MQMEESNPQAIEDLRTYIKLCTQTSRQIVVHDMIEKRYAVRPYGWPDVEVLLLLARLLVLGDISLMMDGALLPLEKVYETLTSPSKRRKIIVIQRQTSDPKALQQARALGRELFHEMGPDGEDSLYTFLHNNLQSWQSALSSYQLLAETGNYPGKDEITAGLALVKKLLAYDSSYTFIEQCNSQKHNLLDLADNFHDLEQFYEYQKPTWEKLRQAYDRFQLNRLALERDAQAGPALQRMREILTAPSPYSLIKQADDLITKVSTVNTVLVHARRQQATAKIDGYMATLLQDMAAVKGDTALRAACLTPLEVLRRQVEGEESLPHITQLETEALQEFDAAAPRIEAYVKPSAAPLDEPQGSPIIKKSRIVEPARLMQTTYLETLDDVHVFLDTLRQALEQAIRQNERVRIR